MNLARIAELHRQIAKLHEELAMEYADDGVSEGNVVPIAKASKTRQRRERHPREMVRPPGEASPAIAGLARRILHERGFR